MTGCACLWAADWLIPFTPALLADFIQPCADFLSVSQPFGFMVATGIIHTAPYPDQVQLAKQVRRYDDPVVAACGRIFPEL